MKRVVFGICAGLAFIVSAVLTDIWPVFAPLFLFLDIIIGWVCGYFYRKEVDFPKMVDYETEVQSLKATILALKKEKAEAKKAPKKAKE